MVERIILITGRPGVGKTTLIQDICKQLQQQKIHDFHGFYTEEVRAGYSGTRIGFDFVTLDGQRGVLARATTSHEHLRVGKYAVLLDEFERFIVPLLMSHQQSGKRLLVLDEIGKMELLSERFKSAICGLANTATILATIPKSHYAPAVVNRLRQSPHALLYELTEHNRQDVKQQVFAKIQQLLKRQGTD